MKKIALLALFVWQIPLLQGQSWVPIPSPADCLVNDKVSLMVLCPRIPLYFDFVQDSSHLSGRRWRGDFAPLGSILGFCRLYDKYLQENPSLIAGIQANLWTETIHSPERLDFMTFPRITALAEIAWSPKEMPDYAEFLKRLQPSLALYKRRGISFFNPGNPELTPEIKGPVPLLPVE